MLYKFLHKNGLAVAFALAIVAGLTATLALSIGSIKYEDAFKQASQNKKVIEVKDVNLKNQKQREIANDILEGNETERVGVLVGWGLFLSIVAGLVALIFPLLKSIKEPKSLIKFGAGFIGILLLIGICYSFSTDTVLKEGLFEVKDGAQISGAVVGSLVVCVIIAILSIVAGEVYRIVKERR